MTNASDVIVIDSTKIIFWRMTRDGVVDEFLMDITGERDHLYLLQHDIFGKPLLFTLDGNDYRGWATLAFYVEDTDIPHLRVEGLVTEYLTPGTEPEPVMMDVPVTVSRGPEHPEFAALVEQAALAVAQGADEAIAAWLEEQQTDDTSPALHLAVSDEGTVLTSELVGDAVVAQDIHVHTISADQIVANHITPGQILMSGQTTLSQWRSDPPPPPPPPTGFPLRDDRRMLDLSHVRAVGSVLTPREGSIIPLDIVSMEQVADADGYTSDWQRMKYSSMPYHWYWGEGTEPETYHGKCATREDALAAARAAREIGDTVTIVEACREKLHTDVFDYLEDAIYDRLEEANEECWGEDGPEFDQHLSRTMKAELIKALDQTIADFFTKHDLAEKLVYSFGHMRNRETIVIGRALEL